MLTREEVLTAHMFHDDFQRNADGTCQRWRRNGVTKTWKTRPNDFRIPVRYGLYVYGYITQDNADRCHTQENCTNERGRY